MFDDSSSRIERHLRVLAQEAAPGEKLPSTRVIASRFGAGPVTVQRALAALVAEGVVETRPGLGTFVRARTVAARADVDWQTTALGPVRGDLAAVGTTLRDVAAGTIEMHQGYPDEALLPTREVSAAVARAAKDQASRRRPPVSGIPELRRWFADELSGAGNEVSGPTMSGASWHESDVLIASGGQAALAASFRALAAPGETIVMESPTYWGAIGAARAAGLVIVPVPRVDGAPSPDDLDAALQASGARVFYAQPSYANPTGDRWTPLQRREIVHVVTDRRAFLIEDDWAHDFGIDEPVRPLAASDVNGHVVYIRSLTKSLSLAVRVAAVAARGPVRRRIEQALAHSDLFVSPVLQAAALDVVSRPVWPRHRRALTRALGERRDALLASLAAQGFTVRRPGGGLHLWVPVGELGETDARLVTAKALAAGLAISPGGEWFPAEETAACVRLAYGAADPARYDEAASILAAAVER